ncbi:hypothetical protein F4778DRAFT_443364 [Xylariomycetidae sp. FL2044]|nr:hypothetical protein F4778DRAFT_443364 [Xylariomycetidae sp. FL2044]
MTCSVCRLPIADNAHGSGLVTGSRACPFCSVVFSRVDAAKRHAKTCPQRGHQKLPVRKRGRKANACLHCSRIKVHCNARGQTPCERCVARKLDCTSSRFCTCTDSTHRQTIPLSFLLNVTDDRQDFINERDVGEEPDAPLLGPTCVTSAQDQVTSHESTALELDYIDPTLLLPAGPLSALAPWDVGGLYDTEEQSLLGGLLFPPTQEDRLSTRLDLLESDVSSYVNFNNTHQESFNSATFRRFFNTSNVRTFAMVFCRKRHYRYTVIHWPTFDLEEASLPLLMVVSLTGATYSYGPGHGPEHITDARRLYHLADSYVFHQLKIYLNRPPADSSRTEAIQLCQAALLMYGLDTLLAGDLDMQRIALTERLPALVSAMRRLEFVGCQHNPSEDWETFLQRECMIRLVAWTYCADCLATLSCNNPPNFSMFEMVGDLPCHPGLWDADSVSELELEEAGRQGNRPNLKHLMANLLDDKEGAETRWECLSFSHLPFMLCALQQIIFNLHVSMSLDQQSEKLIRALKTWRLLWGQAMEKMPNHQHKWLGVTKNLPDIEILTRRIIEVAVGPDASSSRYLQRVQSCGSREIHEFIRRFISKI